MIAKPGKNPNDITSDRPISLLPTLSKILEKLILKRLLPIIEDCKIIPSHQFGFRRKHETTEQVHRLVHTIHKAMECKQYCSAVFLDISQAFDKVWHTGLLYKLKRTLPHAAYTLLKSYLSDRMFQVRYQEEYTPLHTIHSGVPQGSILGPILYSIYTADLPVSEQTTTATYADDTAILASHRNRILASRNLQTHLAQLEKWFINWRTKANEGKSTHVTFTLNKEAHCPAVTLSEKQISQGNAVKYLGIHMDRRMTWRPHILAKRNQLGLKLQHLYWLLGRKSELTTENKLLLYKTVLNPIWTYGIQLWGTASNSNIEILQRLQNKVLRVIVNAPWYISNNVLHKDLKTPTIREEITHLCANYHDKLVTHPNELTPTLLDEAEEPRRLKRFQPSDLSTRFS